MTLNPISKIKIASWVEEPNPLGMVKIEEILEKNLEVGDLDLEQSVTYKAVQQMAADLLYLYTQMDPTKINVQFAGANVKELMAFSLSLISSLNQNAFTKLDKGTELIQDIYAETNFTEKLKKLFIALRSSRDKLERLISEKMEQVQQHPQMGMKDNAQIFGEAIKNIRDDRVEDVRKFREKLEGKKVPDIVKSKFEEEVGRYLSTDKQHSESNVIRTYLGILSSLPWGVTTTDSIDIEKARKILNEGHYGMEDIKQRILELLAVGKLQGKVQGRILCFVGPPGVGKTSIGASIAQYSYFYI